MIEPQRIEQVVEIVRRAGLSEQTLMLLRASEAFADLHFTYCSDDDVGGVEPVHAEDDFNVYLVDGREHCLRLTSEPENATGLLLAFVEPEDDQE